MNKNFKKRVQAVILAAALIITSMMVFVTPASAATTGTDLNRHLNIGYWLGGNGGSTKTLAQADPGWDVINVSFIETKGNTYTANLNMDLKNVYAGNDEEQKAAFIADIQALQAQGKKVVISCGGQNGVVHINNANERDTFLNGIIAIVSEYGFDGFDVDFEGSSIACMNTDKIGNLQTQQSINLEYILRELKSTFGDDFIISAAPEYCYVQGGAISTGNFGAFLPFLDAIRDILTYIHPQYYNGFNGDFSWLQPSANAGAPFTQVYSAEGYVRLSEMLITGFVTMDKGTFNGLRADQVVFGVPSCDGAGNGAQPVSTYAQALSTLIAKYPTFRGIMTWSIGWDETHSNNFVNAIKPVIANANGTTIVEPEPDPDPIVNAQAPTIATQPSDKTVDVDAATSLTVAANVANGTLSYQWYKASANVNTGGVAINGATSATYNVPTDTEGTSYYYCVVTNTDNSVNGDTTATTTSRSVTVTVNGEEEETIVIPPTPGDYDQWDSDTVYLGGEIVMYQGQTYVCKWWSQGDVPSAGGAWELQTNSNDYIPGKSYAGGETVTYQGQTWSANWWTTSVPGTDSSWSLI